MKMAGASRAVSREMLASEVTQMAGTIATLQEENEKLRAENDHLKREVEHMRRHSK